ncbi:MAG: GNAT family N-acetyltransferase [Methylotenera sp.]|uniref:GNAT family N-acetyltransferase n=1 Tax=Methylotenera sp. TaxID=2051956 RepID=UPI0024887381|nr:GNAT family N-acetyltransferase [Methylotenera sp.]MDI1308904.1 GNAT family N-acetyltransferase [Methylotenera sp.]
MQTKSSQTEISSEMASKVIIQQVTWLEAENKLRAVRTPVFIEEQFVTPEFEWDEIDYSAVHLLALFADEPIACLRIIHYEKIGRMAVIKRWRGLGVGATLLLEAINICKKHGSKSICLSAQTHAINFYLKAGFEQTSEEYTDVDIPHVDMRLDL